MFHNNCLYFAHNLIHIITKLFKKIPEILVVAFLNEAIVLRSVAAEKLEMAVTFQRNQLIYILQDSGEYV